MELTDREWREFKFIDIFDIRSGFYNKKPPLDINGEIPFIGATDKNNGFTEFYSYNTIKENSKTGEGKNEDISRKLFNGNCICVTNNGSVGYAYYQVSQFTCSHDVNPLYLKDTELNRFIANFLIRAIEQQRVCFQYSRKWRPQRMVKSNILLPVGYGGKPDWDFMEQYVKELEMKKIQEYREYAESVIEDLEYAEISELSEKEWKEFLITGEEGILSIESTLSGIDKNKLSEIGEGNIPYVTRTDLNNGINLFIGMGQEKKYSLNKGNVITIGLDTQTVFYQPYNFFTGQNIQVIESEKINRHTALFLIRSIKIQMEKFNWGGNGATLGRMAKTKIMLPVSVDGKPDWDYMEQYVKNLMISKYKKYIEIKS